MLRVEIDIEDGARQRYVTGKPFEQLMAAALREVGYSEDYRVYKTDKGTRYCRTSLGQLFVYWIAKDGAIRLAKD